MKIELYGDNYGDNNIIEIYKGITILTGPNGCGKTFACTQICEYLTKHNKRFFKCDVYHKGKTIGDSYLEFGNTKALAKYYSASEGQRVYDTFIDNETYKIGTYIRDLIQNNISDGYIIIDGCDSGVSPDLLYNYRDLFELILEDCRKQEINIYIIITSNSYALIPYYDCIWIPTMEHYRHDGEADGYDLWKSRYYNVYKERNKRQI